MRPFKSIAHMAINHPTLGPPIPDSGGAFLAQTSSGSLTRPGRKIARFRLMKPCSI